MQTHPRRHRSLWAIVLILSASVNLILLWQLGPRRESDALPTGQTGSLAEPPSHPVETVPVETPSSTSRVELRWDALSNLDLRTLRARLLAMGCPEHTVKAVLEMAIHDAYSLQMRALYCQQAGDFWENAVVAKTRRRQRPTPQQDEARQKLGELENERRILMDELVGQNWDRRRPGRLLDQFVDRDSGDPRLSFLPEAKRQRMLEQDRAISELRQNLRSQRMPEEEVNRHLKVLQAEHNAERAQLLSAEELDEYNLRASSQAYFVKELYGFEPTSDERRAIIRLEEAYDGKAPETELQKLLGDERFAQFQRGRDPSFHSIYNFASNLGLGEDRMIAVYELKQNAERLAATVRTKASVPLGQRRATLEALRQQTEAAIGSHFGEAGREMYKRSGGWWMERLTDLRE